MNMKSLNRSLSDECKFHNVRGFNYDVALVLISCFDIKPEFFLRSDIIWKIIGQTWNL